MRRLRVVVRGVVRSVMRGVVRGIVRGVVQGVVRGVVRSVVYGNFEVCGDRDERGAAAVRGGGACVPAAHIRLLCTWRRVSMTHGDDV